MVIICLRFPVNPVTPNSTMSYILLVVVIVDFTSSVAWRMSQKNGINSSNVRLDHCCCNHNTLGLLLREIWNSISEIARNQKWWREGKNWWEGELIRRCFDFVTRMRWRRYLNRQWGQLMFNVIKKTKPNHLSDFLWKELFGVDLLSMGKRTKE